LPNFAPERIPHRIQRRQFALPKRNQFLQMARLGSAGARFHENSRQILCHRSLSHGIRDIGVHIRIQGRG